MERLEKLLRERCPEMELRVNELMSKHTTFRIGGPAALMALPGNTAQVRAVLDIARELDIEPFFLGNGSNLLVADGGYRGFVVKLAGEFEEIFTKVLEDGTLALVAGGPPCCLGCPAGRWRKASPAWSLPAASPAA